MKVHRIEEVQHLPISLQEAWDFFSTPINLQEITPEWLHFEVTSPLPAKMYPGLILSYRIKAMAGIPMTWVTEIKHVVEGEQFVDEQRFGPYKFWHHRHLFEEVSGGVKMTDQVHYGMFLGPIGELVHEFYVKDQLRKVFDFRRLHLEKRYPLAKRNISDGVEQQ